MNTIPSRMQLKEVIQKLNVGMLERSQVAKWAFSIIDDDNIKITDQVVWDILGCLGAVDLLSTDNEYLYGKDDFIFWINKIDNSPSS
ncbi:hypothetical protein [Serratia microhaemolytica]|uniref:hypothetical protein n=1 Tax=Serratia microhaemolytica TaxID=2675110 RepID=UPI000FDDD8BF|nr:hypothetical protein [Serratia microhaemolytica]